jgi:ribose transport system substrate-binding protein
MGLSKPGRVFLAIAVAAHVAFAACARADTPSGHRPRLAFVTNGVASFWVIGKAGADAAAKQYNDDLSVLMPANGISDQKRMVEDLLVRGVDGLAISLIDAQNQAGMVNDAAAQTNLITHDSDAPGTKRLAYVGMDNYKAGRMVGTLVKEALPKGGSVMLLIGRTEQDNARKRRQGVIDELLGRSEDGSRYDPPGGELKGDKFTIVGTLTDQFDRAKAKANAEDALLRFPDLGALVGLFAYNTPAALEALKQAGKLDTVKVVSFDEADETLQAVKDGHCFATVVQDPYRYGYESVRILDGLAKGNKSVLPPAGFLDIPARIIRRDNVEAFWNDLKAKLGKS